MYLATKGPHYGPQVACSLVGRQEKHSIISYCAATRVITNIPTLRGCLILNFFVLKLSTWYSSSSTALASVLRGDTF